MNKHIIIIGAILIGLVGVYFFFSGNAFELPLTVAPAADPIEQEFIALTNKLSGISFDLDIFSDTRFMRLVSLSTPVQPEPIGRLDPFARLGP
jgi:hypothetical protein